MNFYGKLTLRLAAAFGLSILAFNVAFFLTGAYYNHYVVPELVKKYPHDGQVGLGGFMGALSVAFVSAIVIPRSHRDHIHIHICPNRAKALVPTS